MIIPIIPILHSGNTPIELIAMLVYDQAIAVASTRGLITALKMLRDLKSVQYIHEIPVHDREAYIAELNITLQDSLLMYVPAEYILYDTNFNPEVSLN